MTEAKHTVLLDPQRMHLRESHRQDWVVDAQEGTTQESVLDQAYWAHMASRLQPFDRIEVRLETGEWIMELVVIDNGRNWARVHPLHVYDLQQARFVPAAQDSLEVAFKGPHLKHCVIRSADGEILAKGISTKEDAIAQKLRLEGVAA